MSERIEPVPGDPSTEPVATAAQSHVDGRVGPPTIAQDADAAHFAPAGVEQIEPGALLPADTPVVGGYAGPQPRPAPAGDAADTTAVAPAEAAPYVVDDQAPAQPVDPPAEPAPETSVVAEPVHAPADTAAAAPASQPTTDARG